MFIINMLRHSFRLDQIGFEDLPDTLNKPHLRDDMDLGLYDEHHDSFLHCAEKLQKDVHFNRSLKPRAIHPLHNKNQYRMH